MIIVRSQDRKLIINCNYISTMDGHIVGASESCNDTFVILGKYDSEERIIEILDGIDVYIRSKINGIYQMPIK